MQCDECCKKKCPYDPKKMNNEPEVQECDASKAK